MHQNRVSYLPEIRRFTTDKRRWLHIKTYAKSEALKTK
jgi:hypothetical protein